jgi:hypothetical protein
MQYFSFDYVYLMVPQIINIIYNSIDKASLEYYQLKAIFIICTMYTDNAIGLP